MITSPPVERGRVLRWFSDHHLIRPGAQDAADLVDLMRAIATVCAAPGIAATPRSSRLATLLAPAEHLVLVLIDGLGSALLDAIGARDGFLSHHVAEHLETVFPSTTAVALTSLATACYPAEHGVPGWWAYLGSSGLTAEVLPFVERFSRRRLDEIGVTPDLVFPMPSIFPTFQRDQLVVTRGYISNSTYSRYWSGGSASVGYEHLTQGVDLVRAQVRAAQTPSFTHFYINQLDSLCHERGIGHPQVRSLLALIDHEVERLCHEIGGRARVVITADHGHIDAGMDVQIQAGDPLLALLRCPPTGESRATVFHLRSPLAGEQPAELSARFREGFTDRFGEHFALLTIDEVEELSLLGPGPLSQAARRHFGDFMAISGGAQTLRYLVPNGKNHRQVGVHAGLSHEEMTVPLILA